MSEDDVIVIGRLADADVARDWAGHALLPRGGWSLARNLAFVRDIVEGRRVFVASAITGEYLVDKSGALTLFGFELAALFLSGFVWRGATLLPPPRDPFGDALAADPSGFYRRLRLRAASGDLRVPELVPMLRHIAELCPPLAVAARTLAADGAPYAQTIHCAHAFARAIDDEARAGAALPAPIYGPKVAGGWRRSSRSIRT